MSDRPTELHSAYAKLAWAHSRHEEMERTFEKFVRASEGGTPYGIQCRLLEKPPGAVRATFIVEREMPDEMSLLAGDVAHNTRVALDHTLAKLKEHFGGDPGRGSFPICQAEDEWTLRVANARRRSPLRGLEGTPAFDVIYRQQPLHRPSPQDDALVIVNKLDNDDKHRLLQRAFVYPAGERGVDLIEILDRGRLRNETNHWTAGQPLIHGTLLASYLFRGRFQTPPLRARSDASIGFAVGDRDGPRVGFVDLIERVREIVDEAAQLLDVEGRPQAALR